MTVRAMLLAVSVVGISAGGVIYFIFQHDQTMPLAPAQVAIRQSVELSLKEPKAHPGGFAFRKIRRMFGPPKPSDFRTGSEQ